MSNWWNDLHSGWQIFISLIAAISVLVGIGLGATQLFNVALRTQVGEEITKREVNEFIGKYNKLIKEYDRLYREHEERISNNERDVELLDRDQDELERHIAQMKKQLNDIHSWVLSLVDMSSRFDSLDVRLKESGF